MHTLGEVWSIGKQPRSNSACYRSVFDLVKVTHFLELTDPKLLGWYLSLPVEDRKLIQGTVGTREGCIIDKQKLPIVSLLFCCQIRKQLYRIPIQGHQLTVKY